MDVELSSSSIKSKTIPALKLAMQLASILMPMMIISAQAVMPAKTNTITMAVIWSVALAAVSSYLVVLVITEYLFANITGQLFHGSKTSGDKLLICNLSSN